MDIELISLANRVLIVITGIFVTAFPILYSRSAWAKSVVGRTLMLQAVSLAIAIDLTVWRVIFHAGDRIEIVVAYFIVFLLLSLSSGAMIRLLWKINYKNRKSNEQK